MRILIFGGAFDPPHLGHLGLLEKALRLEFFDEIWLMPTFVPPLKMNNNNSSVAGSEERLEMCKLLIKSSVIPAQAGIQDPRLREDDNGNQNDIRVLDLEIKRGGKSYTIETARELKKLYPGEKFYFLIGSDWVKDLSKWYKSEELLKEIEFIALPRTEISSSKIREKIKNGQSISGLVPEEIEEYIRKYRLYK